MILRDFNNGWGPQFELRRFEQHIANTYLDAWHHDSIPSILVNSTWYNRDYHNVVLEFMAEHQVRRVGLISFMDPAIVQSDWFHDTGAEVRCVGYYPTPDEIDIWALIVDRYFDTRHQSRTWSPVQLDTPFLCYNRKPHWHRMRLYKDLQTQGCIDKGVVTMGHQSGQPLARLVDDVCPTDIAPNPGVEQYGIVNDIMSLGPGDTWDRCFLNVVTETVFDVDKDWFVSEKIYKPIVGARPFVVYAPQGAARWLTHIGIESYLDDFRDISDLDLQEPRNIAPFLAILSQQGADYYQHKYQELRSKIHHNQACFRTHVACTHNKIHQGIQPVCG